jgi:large subunit ribosomal protein L32e
MVLGQEKKVRTMESKTLLKIRLRQKRKKPEFIRQEYYTHPHKLGRKWRQPMGRTSKLRYKEKSRGSHPSMGYSSPAAVRGLTRFGYRLVRVSNVSELSKISDPKAEMAEIASGVGNKKRLDIINAAKQKGMLVFNRPRRSLEKKKKPASDKKDAKKEDRKESPARHEHKK